MKVFNAYAMYYDLLYKDKNYDIEADYLDRLLQSEKPGSQSVLEMGCGTGLHAFFLAKKNYSVHGVDRSEEMIERAFQRKDSSLDLSFTEADICHYRAGEMFDAAIALFHVISYLKSNQDLLAALETAQVQLKTGGIFLFDCWYGPAVLSDPPKVRVKRMEDEHISIVRIAEPLMYPNLNLVDVNYTIWIWEKKTQSVSEIKETHTMRYFFQPEIEHMLNLSGFTLLRSHEWLSGRDLSFHTWNGCFLAKKNE